MAPIKHRLFALLTSVAMGAGLVVMAPAPASAASATLTIDGPLDPAVTYEAIIFEGQLAPAGATPRVVLQVQVEGGWTDVNGLAPRSDGSFEIPFATKTRGTYHVRARSLHGSVLSNVIEVEVKPHPTVIDAGAHPARDVVAGQRVSVTGDVVESTATPRVVVQRKVDGRWSDRQAGPVDAKGRFAVTISPSQSGHYELRVRSAGGSRWSELFSLDVAPQPVP